MNSMIVSAFPGCGKTFLARQEQYKGMTFSDSDSSKFPKTEDRYKLYADYIESKLGKYDFIFISQQDEILKELHERGLHFSVVAPDNSTWIDDRERQLIKQQWFGRFVLRDNSHIYTTSIHGYRH